MSGYEINKLLVDPRRSGFTLIHHQGQRETISSKPSSSPHSVHEISVVWVVEALVVNHRDIVIYHQINLWNVDASCKHICRYQGGKNILTEVVDDFIALVVLQTSNKNFCFDSLR